MLCWEIRYGNSLKPSTAKAKGADTEIKFVTWLIEKWGIVNAERRHLNGVIDKGDIAGWSQNKNGVKMKDVCCEVKSGASLNLPGWLRELKVEKANAKADVGFVTVRPKGKPNVDDWYAIMPMPEFMELLGEAGYLYD